MHRVTLVPMTALPLPLDRLLTVAEYEALPEDGETRHELEEGVLVTSRSRCASTLDAPV